MLSDEWAEDLARIRTQPVYIHSTSWHPPESDPVPVAELVSSAEGGPASSWTAAGHTAGGKTALWL